MLEGDDRRQRTQPLDLNQDFRAECRVRFHHFPLALVERARLLEDAERDPRLADVVQERGFDQRGSRRFVEAHLLAEQQAEHRDVHRMAVGQVLVLLDGEDLSERGVAARHFVDEELDEIADGDGVELPARRNRFERLLCEYQRLFVRRVERASRRVGPLMRAPARVERDQPAEADVPDVAFRELALD